MGINKVAFHRQIFGHRQGVQDVLEKRGTDHTQLGPSKLTNA